MKLNDNELKEINGGGIGLTVLLIAGLAFAIGVLDGYVRPTKCK